MTVAILAIIASFFVLFLGTFRVGNDLAVAENVVVDSIKRAQNKAFSGEGDIAWGVEIENKKVTIFKGSNFIGRDKSFDEIFIFPREISISGISEVFFSKFSGLPNVIGAINLILNNVSKTININEQGVLNN